MSSYAPHERNDESGSSSSLNHTSCSSSSLSPRKGAPTTPPQNSASMPNGRGFSSFFPWVKQSANQPTETNEHGASETLPAHISNMGTAMAQPSDSTPFEQRETSHFVPHALRLARSTDPCPDTLLQTEQIAAPSASSDLYQNLPLGDNAAAASQQRAGHFTPFSDSSLDYDSARSPFLTQDSLLSPLAQDRDEAVVSERRPPQSRHSFIHTDMVSTTSLPLQPQPQLGPVIPMPTTPIGNSSGRLVGTAETSRVRDW